MKKIIIIVLLFITTISCKDKKNTSIQTNQLSDSLSLHLTKVKDTTLLRSERIAFIQKAESFILKQKQDSLFIHNLFKVANQYYNIGEMEAYKTTSQLIAEKANQINDNAGIAKAEEYLGDYYKNKSTNDSAYICYSKAERIYTELNNKENIGRIFLNKALLYYNEGDYLHSQIAAYKSLSYYGENENQDVFRIYNLIGILFDELKQYDNAIQFYNKAFSIIKDTTTYNGKLFTINTLNNLGVVYRNLGKNKEAITYYKQALQYKNIDKEIPVIYTALLDNLAYSQLQLKDYSQLPDLFYKALHIRDSLQIIPGINVNKRHLSEYYQDQNNTTKAIQYAQEAYTIAKEKGIDPRDILLSLKQLRKVDPSNEAVYLSEYVKITDSLKLIEPLLPNKLVQAQYENEELIFEKAQLEKDRKNIIIWSISIVSLFSIAFLINYLKTKKKEARLKLETARQKTEIVQQKANEEIHELLSEQQAEIESTRRTEKSRIAKELHDGIISKLVGTRVILEALNDRPDLEAREQAIPYIDALLDIEDEIRSVAHNLHFFDFSKNSFETLLKTLIEKQEEISKTKFSLIMGSTIEWDTVRSDIKMHLYRIVQESLQNIYKYAQAAKVVINIFEEDSHLKIKITDDGIGFNTQQEPTGIGLKSIKSRVEELKGTIKIISAPEKGTSIESSIPL